VPLALPTRRLPFQPDLTQMLRGLLDKEVVLERVDPAGSEGYHAIYVNKNGEPVAALRMDLPLAASAGAALALIPAGQVEGWLESGELPDDAYECTYEVLNVLASAFNQADEARHVKLSHVLAPGEPGEGRVARGINGPRAAEHFTVEVPGFPGGRLSAVAF
jgi:hypothetical protein